MGGFVALGLDARPEEVLESLRTQIHRLREQERTRAEALFSSLFISFNSLSKFFSLLNQ